MSFIDNVVGWFSPQAAYKRAAWRQAADELRNYDAASYGRTSANWRVFNESAELTDRNYRDVIRARSRDLERNSDIANSTIRAYKRNVVGKGYTLQAQTADTDLNNLIEKAWKTWSKRKNCDVTGTQSFQQIVRMMVQRKKVDGGIIGLKRYTKGAYLPFQLQILEVDELDTTQTTPKHTGNTVIGGVEYNQYHKAVGYFIRQYDMDGWQMNDPVYIPAEDVIFYFSKTRPSQVREMSDLTPTINRIRDINEFITAVSVKERIAACLAVFIKKALPTGGHGRSNTMTVDGKVDYAGKTLAPGMIKEMNAGDEIDVVNPNSTGNDASQFLKLQYGLIGAGQGLSYETVSRDMSQSNYSSARQSSIEDELTYEEERELLEECVLDEVYETFLISGYLAGLFNMPGFWERKDEYMAHEWVRSPKQWIDPAKEANATRIALQTGQKTYKEVAAENGRDWQEQIDDIVDVIEYGRERGIELGGVIFGQGITTAGTRPEE